MTREETKLLRRLVFIMERLCAKLDVDLTVPKTKGGAEVTVVTRVGSRMDGAMIEGEGGAGDVPSALTEEQREAMAWQQRPRSMKTGRRDTKRFDPRGE